VNSGGLGGAVYSFNSSTATLTNCVVWGNISQDGLQISQATGTPAVRYSDIQGGYAGTANLNSDPIFIRNPAAGPDNKWGTADDDYGDLHVSPTSPLLDAGNNADIPAAVLTDLDANSRLVDIVGIHDPGTLVDIGAYEKSPPLVVVAAQFSTAAIRPTLTFTFNCAVQSASAIAADLILTDRATNRSFNAQGFADVTYDRASFSISWQFYALPSANYDASVAAMSISDMSSAGLSADFSTALYILSADGDRNRQVDIHDFNILATNFGKSGQTFEQGNYDYSADGKVTITDFNILATNFGKHLDPPAGPSPVSAAAPIQTMAIGEVNRTAPAQGWLYSSTDDTNLLSDIGLV
jgi:hypothetical protein